MDDIGPVESSDITRHLRHAESFGVTGARSPDGHPTIELTTSPDLHGPHGRVSVRWTDTAMPSCSEMCEAPEPTATTTAFTADLKLAGRGFVRCRSSDAMRFWGRFSPEAELVVASTGDVRLVARTIAGEVLAGPITVSPDAPPTVLSW